MVTSKRPQWQRVTLLDAGWDASQDQSELNALTAGASLDAVREFDWNDRTKLYEGGPRAARDRRASRFALC